MVGEPDLSLEPSFCCLGLFYKEQLKTVSAQLMLISGRANTLSDGMFIAARGFIGIGLVLNITAAPLLVLELAFPTQRVSTILIMYV